MLILGTAARGSPEDRKNLLENVLDCFPDEELSSLNAESISKYQRIRNETSKPEHLPPNEPLPPGTGDENPAIQIHPVDLQTIRETAATENSLPQTQTVSSPAQDISVELARVS